MIRLEGFAGLNRQGDKIKMPESLWTQQITIFLPHPTAIFRLNHICQNLK